MLKESEVEEILRRHLKEHGFTVVERTRKQGVDIQAAKDSRIYYVEIEGSPKLDVFSMKLEILGYTVDIESARVLLVLLFELYIVSFQDP